MTNVRIGVALLSVADKTDLLPFVKTLHEQKVSLLSTGGTFKLIKEAGHPVREVARYTGFPEMMGGRVKTLHPKIHGGLLGRRPVDDAVMAQHGIAAIDLLVCNLYPFAEAVANDPANLANAIENIDIGGPAMLRSAAKNFESVAVIVDIADYEAVARELRQTGGKISRESRYRLAARAFERVAEYDAAISSYLAAGRPEGGAPKEYPASLTLQFSRRGNLRYGENPHQSAAFYVDREPSPGNIATAIQRQGKDPSYNNIADADAALRCVASFSEPACVIVKHANPCGVAEGADLSEAYGRAFSTDPTSAFGGIIAFNRKVDEVLAAEIISRQFVEVVIAPAFAAGAIKAFAGKKNIRVLEVGPGKGTIRFDYKAVAGGLLVQSADNDLLDEEALRVATRREPAAEERRDLMFAWKVAKYVKSNAIVYARGGQTIGIGAGQMSRVISARVALLKAEDEGLQVSGSVMASDAFFPFRDSIDAAAAAGITAVIQPGGSMRDKEVIDAADEAGMAMILTGMRHFRH